MNNLTEDEILVSNYKHKHDVENLKEKEFVELWNHAYPHDKEKAREWWNEFNQMSLVDKVHFILNNETISFLFEGFCIGKSFYEENLLIEDESEFLDEDIEIWKKVQNMSDKIV